MTPTVPAFFKNSFTQKFSHKNKNISKHFAPKIKYSEFPKIISIQKAFQHFKQNHK